MSSNKNPYIVSHCVFRHDESALMSPQDGSDTFAEEVNCNTETSVRGCRFYVAEP